MKVLEAGQSQHVFQFVSLKSTYNLILSILIYPATDSILLEQNDLTVEQELQSIMGFIMKGLQR